MTAAKRLDRNNAGKRNAPIKDFIELGKK